MVDHQFPGRRLRYYLSAPVPCPYLEGRLERKVFTHLPPFDALATNDQLSQIGFRRSQHIAYRPACETCSACQSLRIISNDYEFSASDRRTLAKNSDLERTLNDPIVAKEHYDLLVTYLSSRHPDGGMMDMDFDDLRAMVEDTQVHTHLLEYRLKGRLVATVLVDRLNDGLSMIYSFYDPQLTTRSLGHFMILDHISQAQKVGYDYVYLGFYVENSAKMSYKARYRPHERLIGEKWRRYD